MKTNNTKKKIVLGVVLVGAVIAAGLQSAGAGTWGGGPHKWGAPPCGECAGYGYQRQLPDEKYSETRKAFLGETVELRKQIEIKKAEKHALMRGDNPDAKRVAQLTGELFDLREQLHTKAQEQGLGDVGFGRGQGRGCGGPGPRGFQGQL
ncbi:MAG TPA: periplasmic heavy metal sensor [Desulfobacteraceae bacterium]|nr:periplasmic heavy metal sensor [Desulfobacteraceae bacterium]